MIDTKKVNEQAKFCEELMNRLCAEVKNAEVTCYAGIVGHTRIQNDIVRLRRELRALYELLDPYRKDG